MFYINLVFLFIWIFFLFIGIISGEADKEDIFHTIAWVFNFAYLALWTSSLSLPIAFNYGAESFLATIWAIDSYMLYKANANVKFIASMMTVLWIATVFMRFAGAI